MPETQRGEKNKLTSEAGRTPASGGRWGKIADDTRPHGLTLLNLLVVALGLAAGLVWMLRQTASSQTITVVAARDLPSFYVIRSGDVTTASVSATDAETALTAPQEALGHLTQAPFAAGATINAHDLFSSTAPLAGRAILALPISPTMTLPLESGDVTWIWGENGPLAQDALIVQVEADRLIGALLEDEATRVASWLARHPFVVIGKTIE